MARRFTRMIRGREVAVRQNIWSQISIPEVAVPAASILFAASFLAGTLSLRPFTIVRTHLLVTWGSDQSAADEDSQGAVGSVIVQDQAIAIGVTALPAPITNADASYYFWQPMAQRFEFGSGVGFAARSRWQYEIDSKAMRKVGINEDQAIMVENIDATSGLNFSAIGRQLLKLH